MTSLHGQIDRIQRSKRDASLSAAASVSAIRSFPSSSGMGGGATSPAAGSKPTTTNSNNNNNSIKLRRSLKGHFGKVTAIQWSADSKLLVSASQDGNLILWNPVTNNKVQSIPLKSAYVMAVAIQAQHGSGSGHWIACGGLDNLCTIYNTTNHNNSRGSGDAAVVELASHDGYLSACRFWNESLILTGSGDSTCILWDINTAKPVSTFCEHTADVTSLALQHQHHQSHTSNSADTTTTTTDHNIFASTSVDGTTKIWDIRSPTHAVQSYGGSGGSLQQPSGDINGVEFMPSQPSCFATCGQDYTVRIYDMRAYNELVVFNCSDTPALANLHSADADVANPNPSSTLAPAAAYNGGTNNYNNSNTAATNNPAAAAAAQQSIPDDGFTCLSFSKSGRVIFCGTSDGSMVGFDSLKSSTANDPMPTFVMPQAHERRVSAVCVSPSGDAVATASWDGLLKIWA